MADSDPRIATTPADPIVIELDLRVCRILSEKISYFTNLLLQSDPDDMNARDYYLNELSTAVATQADHVARIRGASDPEKKNLIDQITNNLNKLD